MTAITKLNLLVFVLIVVCLCGGALAQQRPAFNTPKFDNTTTHRQDMCGRQRQLFNDEIDLADALKGLNLTVVLTQTENFFSLNDQGEIKKENPGMFVVLLDELARRAGFQWRNTFGVVAELDPGEDEATWSDLLQWETDTYDLSVEIWSKKASRIARAISFPEGWHDSSIILVERMKQSGDETQFEMWNFLLPFEYGVWGLIAVSIIFTGLVYWTLERVFDKNSDERVLQANPGDTIFLSALTFTQNLEFQPNSKAAQLLAFSCTFWALIIGSAYTANLASFLVVQNAPVFRFPSIEQAALARTPMCIQDSSSADRYIRTKYPAANLVRKKSEEEMFMGLNAGECQAVITKMSTFQLYERKSNVNIDCSLKWAGRTVQIVNGGFATAIDTGTLCTSLVSYVLDLHLVQMKADGFIERAWESHLQGITDQTCTNPEAGSGDADGDYVRLGINEMGGIFAFHGILCAVSIAVAAFQYFMTSSLEQKDDAASGGDLPEDLGDSDVDDFVESDIVRNDKKVQPTRRKTIQW